MKWKKQRLLHNIKDLISELQNSKIDQFNRRVPVGDLFTDRHLNAKNYGFGPGTTCYDSVIIIGKVIVGNNTWIGPNVILDGTGGLTIGDYVSISAGSQIYSHSSVEWSRFEGSKDMQMASTSIGNGVYIGPNSVIQMGTSIGNNAVIGALSFVNKDVPEGKKAFGSPIIIL